MKVRQFAIIAKLRILSCGDKTPKTYGTFNLLKHLHTHHKAIFSELQTAEETEERVQASGKEKFLGTQQTLDGFVKCITPFGLTTQCHLRLLNMLLK